MDGRGAFSLSGSMKSYRTKKRSDVISGTLREAIGALGSPATIEQAMERANEDLIKTKSSAFEENCYNVVVAYELQRRGYNVKALGHDEKLNLGEMIYPNGKDSGYFVSRWTGAFKGAHFEHVGDNNTSKAIANLTSKIKSYGHGARGAVQFDYAHFDWGHVLNFENKNGKVVFIDAQIGKKLTAKEVIKGVNPNTVNVVRTDNLRLSDKARKSVKKR